MRKTVVPFIAEAKLLSDGDILTIPGVSVKTRKHLTFTADIPTITGGGKIYVGHGYELTSASWIEITDSTVEAFSYYSYTDPKKRTIVENTEHGISVRGHITVNIDVAHSDGAKPFAIVSSAGGAVKLALNGWDGCYGDVFVKVEGTTAENCRLTWSSDDFSSRIWIFGDSYIGFGYAARWPYYLYRDGYDHSLIVGYPGMPARDALADLKRIVDKGAPEFAVWCMGMNNLDPSPDTMNPEYLKATSEFIEICTSRGITPILSTIPNAPERNNTAKNNWVRSLGYRYIDFARAVGSYEDPEWYPDMLSPDRVHPATKGAEALYMQVLCDFPEIMQR